MTYVRAVSSKDVNDWVLAAIGIFDVVVRANSDHPVSMGSRQNQPAVVPG